jgi:two-component system response regulator YesN
VGVNFIDYLTERRMAEARRLLADTTESVTTIASRTGFGSPSYFQRVFKRREGLTPLEYRERTTVSPHAD